METTMDTALEVQAPRPDWAGSRFINEQSFCRYITQAYPMIYAEGNFYSVNGMEPEDRVQKLIYDCISPYYSSGLIKKVNNLTDVLKKELWQETLEESETLIHCFNGTYQPGAAAFGHMRYCRCRLPVNYNPKAPKPEQWLNFLSELLEPEDCLTLQEFFGYCLLPVNYAQKMLMIIGKGGEGKSRVGIVASRLFGDNMVNGSLTKLEKSQFARADLQNRLLMVDDDLQLEALTTTGNIKTIVTAEQQIDLERKGVQSYQGKMFCRLMAFGNGSLRALHDRSHGFFRRQIILSAKPRPETRQDDPFLALKLCQELEGILLWAIEGLERLIMNDMCFTISPGAEANLKIAVSEGNNTVDFMASQGYIRLDPLGVISSRSLYRIYSDWCEDNMLQPLSARTFVSLLMGDADHYGIQYTNRIPGGNDRLVRGFRGIRAIA